LKKREPNVEQIISIEHLSSDRPSPKKKSFVKSESTPISIVKRTLSSFLQFEFLYYFRTIIFNATKDSKQSQIKLLLTII
jgi:hypothetical protein